MTDLQIRQFQIGDVVFGYQTAIECLDFAISEPAATVADQVVPGEDGVMMGRDYLQGRTLSWDLMVNQRSPEDGRAQWQALEAAWGAQQNRSVPGAVTSVRIRIPGADTCVAYGRPRKIASTELGLLRSGAVPVTADFATADRFFYADIEQEVSAGIQPTIGVGGGITWPITWPIAWATPDTANVDVVVNGGTAPTWPVITFMGPVVNPTIVFGDNDHTVELVATIAENQYVTIDTRPWARSVVRDDGGSLAGALRGSRLAELALLPGPTTVSMQGINLDGTASGRVRWRNAYTTP